MYAGPISESVPSSITGFAHRQSRAGSTTSFAFFDNRVESPEWSDNEAAIEQSDEELDMRNFSEDGPDIESLSLQRRKSSRFSRNSDEHPLLHQYKSSTEAAGRINRERRSIQKIYVVNEDLTMMVAGFSTSPARYALYIFLCIITLGLGFLVCRWLPRWRVRLIGIPTTLRDCAWVSIEVRVPLP